MKSDLNSYRDIIDHERHVSDKRPPMPREHRAAQFSPFAALTGYDALIREAARLTETMPELTDERKQELDRALRRLLDEPELTARFTFFVPDRRKAGGEIRRVCGSVAGRARGERAIILRSGEKIEADSLIDIEI